MSSKVKALFRTDDGASFTVNGSFEDRVAFAAYMLLCAWGDGESHKPLRKKRDKVFEEEARRFLGAAEVFKQAVEGE